MAVCELGRKKPCRCADQRVRGQAAGGRSCASCARGISASLHVIACVEEPALIAKILEYIRIRDQLGGLEARAPPVDGAEGVKLT